MGSDAVDFLMKVLAIRSVNSRDDEGAVAAFLADYMRNAGVKACVSRIDEKHANVAAWFGLPSEAEPVIWNGHLDTVPYGAESEWQTDPAVPVIRNGKVFCRGASDMKSGLCAMVYALCDAVRKGRTFRNPVYFLGTCDEEKNGIGARAALSAPEIGQCSRILIGEPTGLKMGLAQKGCLWLEMMVSGKTSHGAYPEQGRNAVTYGMKAADQITDFVKKHTHPLLSGSTATITQINGGVAPNMVPDRCMILMDIRYTPDTGKAEILETAEKAAAEIAENTGGEVKITYAVRNDRRAFEIAEDDPFTEELRYALKEEQLPADPVGIHFFTDASILAEKDLEKRVILFGPGEPFMAHKPNEYVEIDKYEKAIRVLSRMI